MQKINLEKSQARLRASNVLIGLLLFVAASRACLRVLVANQQVGNSEKLHILDEKIAKVTAENQVLSEQLASKESLLSLEIKVTALGFEKVPKFAFLPKENDVALSTQTPSL